MRGRWTRTWGTIAALSTAAALAGAGAAAAAPRPGTGTPVTVMTRNIYLGGDITRPLDAVQDLLALPGDPTPQEILLTFGRANHALRATVDATDFPARSQALAREIAATAPDVVGLQEVARWSSGPLQLGQVGVANAATVELDFLATLMDRLAELGADYTVAEEQVESDVEGPAFAVAPIPAADPTARDVRLTMRDVLLVKTGRVKVTDHGSEQYATRLSFDVAGAPFAFIRGYTWADVAVGTKRLRVVNTHLESQFSGIALAQAGELLAGPAAVTDRPVVLVCDCNSDPLDASTKPGDPTPHWQPYRLLTGSLHDTWLAWDASNPGPDPGFTSGFGELVDDPDTSAIDHRIDLVLARGADGSPVAVSRARVVGVDPAERVDGLWPSDHAGVVVRLRP